MNGGDRFNQQLRRLVREEAPRAVPVTQRFLLAKKKPLTLEALHSDIKITEEDEGFEATREVREKGKVGDVVVVVIEPEPPAGAGGVVAMAIQRTAKEAKEERDKEKEEGGGGKGEVTKAELEAERKAREGADSSEAGTRTSADNALSSAITKEVGDRESAVAGEASARAAAIISAVNAEKTAREGADAAEKTLREAADGSEKAAREAADGTEKTNREAAVAAEAKIRGEADASEQAARESAIASEKSARESADITEKGNRESADNLRVLKTTLEASGVGFVNHKAEAGKARPTGYATVMWLGTVEPTNATATDFVIYENSSALHVPAAKVYKAAGQSVAAATVTLLTFDSERYDNSAIHSTVTNTSRLVAPKAGVYLLSVNIAWASSAVGERWLAIRKNGVEAGGYLVADRRPSATDAEQIAIVQTFLNAGDYVEALAYQTSGGALATEATTLYEASQQFAMTWLGSGLSSSEPVDWGLVTALPAGAEVGDYCSLKVRESEAVPWKVWRCQKIEAAGERPWAKIGGPPLIGYEAASKETSSEVAQTTGAPVITAPCAMEANFTYGADRCLTPGSGFGIVTLRLNGVGAGLGAIVGGSALQGTPNGILPATTLAKGQTAIPSYSKISGTGAASFLGLFVQVDPVRLG